MKVTDTTEKMLHIEDDCFKLEKYCGLDNWKQKHDLEKISCTTTSNNHLNGCFH